MSIRKGPAPRIKKAIEEFSQRCGSHWKDLVADHDINLWTSEKADLEGCGKPWNELMGDSEIGEFITECPEVFEDAYLQMWERLWHHQLERERQKIKERQA